MKITHSLTRNWKCPLILIAIGVLAFAPLGKAQQEIKKMEDVLRLGGLTLHRPFPRELYMKWKTKMEDNSEGPQFAATYLVAAIYQDWLAGVYKANGQKEEAASYAEAAQGNLDQVNKLGSAADGIRFDVIVNKGGVKSDFKGPIRFDNQSGSPTQQRSAPQRGTPEPSTREQGEGGRAVVLKARAESVKQEVNDLDRETQSAKREAATLSKELKSLEKDRDGISGQVAAAEIGLKLGELGGNATVNQLNKLKVELFKKELQTVERKIPLKEAHVEKATAKVEALTERLNQSREQLASLNEQYNSALKREQAESPQKLDASVESVSGGAAAPGTKTATLSTGPLPGEVVAKMRGWKLVGDPNANDKATEERIKNEIDKPMDSFLRNIGLK